MSTGTAPFYVGQKVVALKDHSQGAFLAGETFVVTGIRRFPCKCNCWVITIGKQKPHYYATCKECGTANIVTNTSEWEFSASRFAPLIEDFQSIAYEKVREQEPVSVN